MGHSISNRLLTDNKIEYSELLLEMSLKDYRKSAITVILVQNLVNVLELSAESFDRIKGWVLRSNEAKELEPSVDCFNELVN